MSLKHTQYQVIHIFRQFAWVSFRTQIFSTHDLYGFFQLFSILVAFFSRAGKEPETFNCHSLSESNFYECWFQYNLCKGTEASGIIKWQQDSAQLSSTHYWLWQNRGRKKQVKDAQVVIALSRPRCCCSRRPTILHI